MVLFALMVPAGALAGPISDITGNWVTIDDHSGKKRSIVTITQQDGKLYGHIAKVFFQPGDGTRCEKCTGTRHNQALEGLEIFAGLTLSEDGWQGGTILDPENGKEYNCRIWLESGVLKVRGYIWMLFRTQTWERAGEDALRAQQLE